VYDYLKKVKKKMKNLIFTSRLIMPISVIFIKRPI